MWLLDVNMPRKLAALLKELGIEAETARSRGWDTFNNGRLVEAAASTGFSCLLTRDRLFGESASRAMKQFPDFSVVVVTLPQVGAQEFLAAFRNSWKRNPLSPSQGQITSWPP